ncbi:sulfite exporter TauE/SafE family protein [Geosporobacter ferrireducens]|uniref:urease accessory protein UreH domain-containing protein n=1 Tax=Geosporobacter ferrireducens TaxID=1424294 RepID=UPI00139C7D27|nr:sulfite exporter TauE/SafE family protein [Geosporobacter ferrireducens]MTI53232.1 heavy metal transporter [Geosporobacter ferrireducens]
MGQQVTFRVDGMVCGSCEKRVEGALMSVKGVKEARANFQRSSVQVFFDAEKTDDLQLKSAIRRAGYEVLEGQEHSLKSVIPWAILLVGAYTIINNSIGFNFIPPITDNMSYGLLLIVGILTSFHCIAMCGGIALSQSIGAENQSKVMPSFLYNAGRVISYTTIGGIVGGLGAVISPSGQFKGIVAVGAGIFMVLFGLKMLNLFLLPSWFRLPIPHISIGSTKTTGPLRPLIIGLLNGFMPCGPLQTMQLYALGTGSVLQGALSMFFFSLGTTPLLFAFGAITSMISGGLGKKMIKAGAVFVMVLGLIMVNRGLALSGVSTGPGLVNTVVEQENEIRMEDGKQIIDLTITSRNYIPSTPVVQAGIPLRIHLDVQGINGCNNPIAIPQYGIEKDLTSGEAFIEFTPDKEGPITITCWMGMITTKLTAVNDLEEASMPPEVPAASGGFFGGGGCCGGQ